MRHTSRFSPQRFLSAMALGVMAATTLVPLAQAQDKPANAPAPEATKPPDPPKPPDKKTRDAARKAYGEGEKAFQSDDFASAYDKFKLANDIIPAPHSEYWMAVSLDKQERAEEAVQAYEIYLNNPGADKVGDDKIEHAKQRLEELKATLVFELNLTTEPAGATVDVDGEPQMGETPMALKLKPGPHTITVAAPGFEPQELKVEAKGGEKDERKLVLNPEPPPPPPVVAAPPPAPPPPPPPPPEKRSMVPAYVTLGIAGAGAVVGTIFGIQALGAMNDFDDQPTSEKADDVERNALIADMAFGVAITLGVTGIVLLTSGDQPAEAAHHAPLPEKAKLEVAPYVSPDGGGAAARLTF